MTEDLRCDSLEEFYVEVNHFRDRMGHLPTMEDPDRRSGAVKGLTVLFFRLDLSPEDHRRATLAFQVSMDEYGRRLGYFL